MAKSESPVPLSRMLLQAAAGLLAAFALIFLPAGTLAWPLGWSFFIAMVAALAISTAVKLRAYPGYIAMRSAFKPGTKDWDKVLVGLLVLALAAVPLVAGLDFRFGGSAMPAAVVALGYLLLAAAMALLTWAQVENRFFELGVRVQHERNQIVVDSGPYRYVRHPGYVAGTLIGIGMALALGSWWALLPAALAAVVLLYRTLREEETLVAGLAGYAHYRRRVPHRWIPGVW